MIAMIIIWVIIILASAVAIPIIIIYKLSNLWMAYSFPALVYLLHNIYNINTQYQFSWIGLNVSRQRGLKISVENWNRDVGKGQGVQLALGVNQRIVGTWAFTRALDWQLLCSCFGHQTNLHVCRVYLGI